MVPRLFTATMDVRTTSVSRALRLTPALSNLYFSIIKYSDADAPIAALQKCLPRSFTTLARTPFNGARTPFYSWQCLLAKSRIPVAERNGSCS